MRDLAIGELAVETGVKVPTIRYYEQIGLLPAPARSDGNQRRYDRGALARLRFIAHGRAMGFSVPAIRSMLAIKGHPEEPCGNLDAMVEDRIADIDGKIARLTALRDELSGMLHHGSHGTIAECRVAAVLSDHEHCHGEH